MRKSMTDPRGTLGLEIIHSDLESLGLAKPWPMTSKLADLIALGVPQRGLPGEINAWRRSNAKNLWRGLRRVLWARAGGASHFYGALYLRAFRADGSLDDYGLASLRVVTDNGVGFIVDAFQNLVELENMKYHGFGTGGGAEAAGNTALTTELTTEYATDSTRPTGSTTESASNIYRTVATLDPDSAVAITEHGVFSQAATGGGTLLDRSLFSAVNLAAAGDTLQATYDLTFTSGS